MSPWVWTLITAAFAGISIVNLYRTRRALRRITAVRDDLEATLHRHFFG